nr:reverse transcriptase domain-containing protein [Tanacetum cinerariifolium]
MPSFNSIVRAFASLGHDLVGIRRVVPRNYNPKGERFLIASRFPTPPLACVFFSLRATETSSSKLARDQTSNLTSSVNPTPKGRIRRSSKQKVENSHFEEHLTPVATMTDNRTMAEMLRAPTEGCAEAITVPPILVEQFELKHSLINMMTSEQFFRLEKDNPRDHGQPASGLKNNPRVQSPLGMIYSEIAKLTHAVNQQTSVVTTAMTAMLKQFQSNPPPAPEFRDNIQGYVSAAAGNYNQDNLGYRPQGEDSDFKDSIDQSVLAHCDDLFVDPTPEMFTDEQPPDYSFPPRFDVYPDDFLEIKSDANFDDDLFDSKGEKIKESELLIDQLDLPCDILSEYDSFNS